jgi:hypothetical protein
MSVSSVWPQYSTDPNTYPRIILTDAEFHESPYELWQAARNLLDVNQPALEIEELERTFRFNFVDIDPEYGKNDPEKPVLYKHKINTQRLGEVKISAIKTRRVIQWTVEWDRRSCAVMMQHIHLEDAKNHLETLGWRADIRNDFPSVTNVWSFFPKKDFENPNLRNISRVNLWFPHQKSRCVIGFSASSYGAK